MEMQRDWTQPIAHEPETYPGSLRAYRHFGPPGSNATLTAVHSSFTYPKVEEGEWWQAKCGTSDHLRKLDGKHKVPDKDCKCGFYLNYYPQNSFYDKSQNSTHPRGVVEASGHMVLGEKGFRAQKMRLVALTPITFALGAYVAEVFPWVKLFTKAEEMYEKYPQDDLTSLLGEEVVERNTTTSLWDTLKDVELPKWDYLGGTSTGANIRAAQNYALAHYGSSLGILAIKGNVVTHQALQSLPNQVWTRNMRYSGYRVTVAPRHNVLQIDTPGINYVDYSYFSQKDPTSIQSIRMGGPQIIEFLLTDLTNVNIEFGNQNELRRIQFMYLGTEYDIDFERDTFTCRQKY